MACCSVPLVILPLRSDVLSPPRVRSPSTQLASLQRWHRKSCEPLPPRRCGGWIRGSRQRLSLAIEASSSRSPAMETVRARLRPPCPDSLKPSRARLRMLVQGSSPAPTTGAFASGDSEPGSASAHSQGTMAELWVFASLTVCQPQIGLSLCRFVIFAMITQRKR